MTLGADILHIMRLDHFNDNRADILHIIEVGSL